MSALLLFPPLAPRELELWSSAKVEDELEDGLEKKRLLKPLSPRPGDRSGVVAPLDPPWLERLNELVDGACKL